ncbi:DUF7261 family protein [Halobellus sp. EA9]|uniref:DUF7261 family protein n=1 Tax=Halobellus sp. EA9 TaxID=3421647 RepID=UPI003EBE0586
MRSPLPGRADDRGQIVLVSAAVVAVALLAMTVAYAQLGYDGDRDAAADVKVASLGEIDRSLAGSVRTAATAVTARNDAADRWRDRRVVAAEISAAVESDVARLERAHAAESRSLTVTFDDAAAARWARGECPGGRGRDFGPCRAIGGIVVQERAGTATPVAAAFRVRVVSPVESTRATLLVRV